MKKFIVSLALVFSLLNLILVNQACNPCRKMDAINLKIHSIRADVKRILGISTTTNSYGSSRSYVLDSLQIDTNGVRYDSIGFDVVNGIYTALNEKEISANGLLYACSPAENYDILSNLEIISDNDYNEAYPKGANLKGIMIVRQGYNIEGTNTNSIIGSGLGYGNYLFTLTYPPSHNRRHTITFRYSISQDQKKFESTVKVYIKK